MLPSRSFDSRHRIALVVAAFLVTAASAGAQSISGRVTDAATNQPLSARIGIMGAAQAAVAHSDGSFQLPVTAGTHIVRVSYIGYAPIIDTVVVGAQGAVRDYKLTKGGQQLEANIVTGTRLSDRTVLNAPVLVNVPTTTEKYVHVASPQASDASARMGFALWGD